MALGVHTIRVELVPVCLGCCCLFDEPVALRPGDTITCSCGWTHAFGDSQPSVEQRYPYTV